MHEKPLGFGCMHENKIFFVFEIRVYFWIFLDSFLFLFLKFQRKSYISYTESVSYSVSLRPDIR